MYQGCQKLFSGVKVEESYICKVFVRFRRLSNLRPPVTQTTAPSTARAAVGFLIQELGVTKTWLNYKSPDTKR